MGAVLCQRVVGILLLLSSLLIGMQASAGTDEIWVLIDTQKMTLSVFEADNLVRRYENISVGRGGVAADRRIRDQKTPLGDYRVVRIANNSAFLRFYHLDYPTPAHAERARQSGVITARQKQAIEKAHAEHRMPPQNTALGGFIGIHGVGAGNRRIHADFNWTEGCVALTNEQLDDLDRYIRIGTRVVIQ